MYLPPRKVTPNVTLDLGWSFCLIVPRCAKFDSENTSTPSVRLVIANVLDSGFNARHPLSVKLELITAWKIEKVPYTLHVISTALTNVNPSS